MFGVGPSGRDAGGSSVLAMFPLGTVLLPGARLGVHVFEPRYRALVRDCLDGPGIFGVVLIARGSEVGGGDERFGLGTVAAIREATGLPDGRSLLVVEGRERIEVVRWLPDDPYPRAVVRVRPEPADPRVDPAMLERIDRRARRVRALAGELGVPVPEPGPVAAGAGGAGTPAGQLAYRVAASLPLGSLDRQRILTAGDTTARLRVLEEALADLEAVLLHRLAGG